jgi:hypothetical protein
MSTLEETCITRAQMLRLLRCDGNHRRRDGKGLREQYERFVQGVEAGLGQAPRATTAVEDIKRTTKMPPLSRDPDDNAVTRSQMSRLLACDEAYIRHDTEGLYRTFETFLQAFEAELPQPAPEAVPTYIDVEKTQEMAVPPFEAEPDIGPPQVVPRHAEVRRTTKMWGL